MMLSFKSHISFVVESTQNPDHEIHYYDLDDTLVHHDNNKLRVHVIDHHGNILRTLTSSEFNTHKNEPHHHYDFSEFRSSDTFGKSAKPIKSVISKLNSMAKKGRKVEILTARADLDDQPKFAHHMQKFGIDIDKIHVRRAGNEQAKSPAEAKKAVIAKAIEKHRYKRIHLYDDSKENLEALLSLNKKYKDVEFHAHHIKHNPKTGELKVTTTSHIPKKEKTDAKV